MMDSTQPGSRGPGDKPGAQPPARSGLLRHSVAVFLGFLVVLFITAPFLEALPNGRFIETALATALMSAAVLAVGGRRRTLALAILLVLPALIGRWLHHLQVNDASFRWYIAGFLVFLGFVVFQFLRFILRSSRVNSEVLCAAISTYLLLGVVWSLAYDFLARANPDSFAGVAPADQPLHGFNSIYFSMITLTTVGYGDITPVSRTARMLAMLESTVGTMYLAVLIARLVSIHSSTAASQEDRHE